MMFVNDATSWSITLETSITLLESSITLLELSIVLLENIYSTGITHGDNHMNHMFMVQATRVIIIVAIFTCLSLQGWIHLAYWDNLKIILKAGVP